MDNDEDFYEEPDSSCQMPPLQPPPTLKDITNLSPANYVPPNESQQIKRSQ